MIAIERFEVKIELAEVCGWGDRAELIAARQMIKFWRTASEMTFGTVTVPRERVTDIALTYC